MELNFRLVSEHDIVCMKMKERNFSYKKKLNAIQISYTKADYR